MTVEETTVEMGQSARDFSFSFDGERWRVCWREIAGDGPRRTTLHVYHAPAEVGTTHIPDTAELVGAIGDAYCYRFV
jgi:hypothetical protein